MSKSDSIWTKDFIMVVLVNLFVFVFFYTFLAVLPIYMIQELGGSESQGGLLISLFLLSAIITRPFSGAIIERFGKKRMTIVSLGAVRPVFLSVFADTQFLSAARTAFFPRHLVQHFNDGYGRNCR
ncbi:MFS transporter [Bacillus amyloliquefaciens]